MIRFTILGLTPLVIIGGVCIAIGIGLYCWVTGFDDPLDEDPDWDRAIDHCGWVDVAHNPPGSSPTNTTGDDVLNLLHERGDIR